MGLRRVGARGLEGGSLRSGGELLLRDTSPLRKASYEDEVSRLARAKTLTVLLGLDGEGKTIVLQFLVEEELVQRVEGGPIIISLAGADLSGVDLGGANPLGANLRGADLMFADLRDANLSYVDLSGAVLLAADLRDANLSNADLSGADLRDANLSNADLSGTDLSRADLSRARGVTEQQLEDEAHDLHGATMPDGSKHP